MKRISLLAILAVLMGLLGGCATAPSQYDYSAFHAAKPVTLLVLPPINDSPDIKATPGVWSHATRPLAEAGYYVLPAALVDETLKQNGIQTAAMAHEIPYSKLREVFGADAAVYVKVLRYGTSFQVINSVTTVEIEGRIVDLRSGKELWSGKALASSAEQSQQARGGLAGILLTAVLTQILSNVSDASYTLAGTAQGRLLGAARSNGIVAGPRSPQYGQPTPSR